MKDKHDERDNKSDECLAQAILGLACSINGLSEQLSQQANINAVLIRIAQLERTIMAAFEDQKALLGTINATTNEIASDIDELITKIGAPGGVSEAQAQEIITDLQGLSTRLQGVAAKYPAPPVVIPPTEPTV